MKLVKVKLESGSYLSMERVIASVKKERTVVLSALLVFLLGSFLCHAYWTIMDIPDHEHKHISLEIAEYAFSVIKLAAIDLYILWSFMETFRYFISLKQSQLSADG